jgi:hypothetical protein
VKRTRPTSIPAGIVRRNSEPLAGAAKYCAQ